MTAAAGIGRARVFEQLFFHASALSPDFGQAGYFQKLAFRNEAKRVLALLDGLLANSEFVAGANDRGHHKHA
jgi:GSH-dependent disulfide-bond oxidoreductase